MFEAKNSMFLALLFEGDIVGNIKRIEKPRTYYLDYLRIFATFAVIVIHVCAQNWYSVTPDSEYFNMFNIFNSAVRWCVPVFVMISGALFLDNDKPLKTSTIYSKYILRLVIAFLFWSAIYAWYTCSITKTYDNYFYLFIEGSFYMWYLIMIIGLYILIPLLREITKSKKATEYFIVIGTIFTIIIPRIMSFLNILKIEKIAKLQTSVQAILNDMNFHFTLGYVLYFVLGYYLAKYGMPKLMRYFSYFLGPLSYIATVILTAKNTDRIGKASEYFLDYMSINVFLMSIFVFVFAKYVLSKLTPKKTMSKFILALSKYSFGVYLVHILVLNILRDKFHFTTLSFPPEITVPVIALLIIIVSYIISAIINHIPLLKKYIV